MDAKFLIPLALVAAAFVLLSGCTAPPLENTETVMVYKFKQDASFEMVTEVSGTLTDTAAEWEDCDEKFKSMMNMFISLAEMSGDMNADQKQSIEAMKAFINNMSCEFEMDEAAGTGKMMFGISLDEDIIDIFKQMSGTDVSGELIKRNADGTIEANVGFPASDGSAPMPGMDTGEISELRVYVEGEVLEITPNAYVMEGGYYAFKDLDSLQGEMLHVKYKKTGGGGLNILGIELSDEMLLLAGGGLIALIVIIIVIVLLIKRGKKKKKSRRGPKLTPQQMAREEILGQRKPKVGEEIFEGTAFSKPRQAQRPAAPVQRPMPQSPMQKPMAPTWKPAPPTQRPQRPVQPTAPQPVQPAAAAPMQPQTQAPASDKEAEVQRLIALLKPKRFDYSRKEIKEVMLEEGYSDETAEEVIRRLGI